MSFKQSALATSIAAALALAAASQSVQAADPDVDALFKESMYMREVGKNFSAIEAMESILQNQPTLQRVRLELAVSYYRVMNYERAKLEAQAVLNDPKTPENVKLAVEVFLAQIKQEEAQALAQKSVFEPSVSVGLLYDSNVNAGPDSSLLPGGLVLEAGSVATEDWGFVFQAGVGHTYVSPNPVRIGESAARFLWKSQANIVHRAYSTEDNFNLTVATLSTGPAWLAANKWRANINFQADYLMQGGDELGLYLTAAPSVSWQFKDAELTADVTYTNKDFSRAADETRDSDYVSGGLTYGRLFKGGRASAQVGLRFFNEDADTALFTNDGYEWFVGANFMAWTNGNIYARYTRNEVNYDSGVLVAKREDNEHRYELGFGHNFKAGKMTGWNLNGSWLHVQNDSNETVYAFDRDMVMVNLGRTF